MKQRLITMYYAAVLLIDKQRIADILLQRYDYDITADDEDEEDPEEKYNRNLATYNERFADEDRYWEGEGDDD